MTIGQSGSEYILGMEPSEVNRLARQHEIWQTDTDTVLKDAGISSGDRVVDLGCGPGFTTFDLLDRVGPDGHVTAIDSSGPAIATLKKRAEREGRTNLTVVQKDIAKVDFTGHPADIWFARWFFSFVSDPEEIIQRIVRSMPIGGRFVVVDYWNYHAIHIEPEDTLFQKVFDAVYRSYRESGGSLDVGGTIPGIFDRHGLRIDAVEPLNHAIQPGSRYWAWIDEFQKLFLPGLVERGYLTEDDLDRHMANWVRAGQSRGTLLFLPPMVGIVGVKESTPGGGIIPLFRPPPPVPAHPSLHTGWAEFFEAVAWIGSAVIFEVAAWPGDGRMSGGGCLPRGWPSPSRWPHSPEDGQMRYESSDSRDSAKCLMLLA